ncbi:MAG: HpcH/HpaI aldolase/citrate lyase family protein [Halioglobus sp.]
MELPINPFKRALATGDTLYGIWLGLPDANVAEIAAGAGFDWLLIDHEHAPFELGTILGHLRAIAPYEVAPVVRPVNHDPALLKKLLEIGVQNFLVPMVETAEQAGQLVQALHYPPVGRRGVGTSLARAARWNQIPNYLKRANDEICLIVQVETAGAMANLEAILDVEGVDGVFIGPSDLAASMGHIGNAGHPEVVAAINRGLEIIVASGRHAGLFCPNPELAADYVKRGARFLGVGVDTLIFAEGARRLVRHFRSGDSDSGEKPRAGY